MKNSMSPENIWGEQLRKSILINQSNEEKKILEELLSIPDPTPQILAKSKHRKNKKMCKPEPSREISLEEEIFANSIAEELIEEEQREKEKASDKNRRGVEASDEISQRAQNTLKLEDLKKFERFSKYLKD